MSREAKTRSQRSGVAVLAAIAAIAGAIQLAAPQPAAAAGGLELQRTAATSGAPNGTDTVKTAVAPCPRGKLVVGGGGAIWEQAPTSARLTSLMPAGNGFLAIAETQLHSGGPDWRVDAYAVCADREALGAEQGKYKVVSDDSSKPPFEKPTDPFKTALARCPAGTVAYGSGASVPSVGRIGLQMNRTSGPLDISRATGRADNAYDRNTSWEVTSFAICAQPVGGVHSEGELDPGTSATHRCSGGDSIAGPGGGGGLVDGGPVWLKVLYPFSNSDVDVEMTGLFPDHQVLASPTCADRE